MFEVIEFNTKRQGDRGASWGVFKRLCEAQAKAEFIYTNHNPDAAISELDGMIAGNNWVDWARNSRIMIKDLTKNIIL